MEDVNQDFDPEVVVCSKCGSAAFTEILTFIKVSAVMSQNGQEGIAPAGSNFICMNCGTDIAETEAVKELQKDKSSLVL